MNGRGWGTGRSHVLPSGKPASSKVCRDRAIPAPTSGKSETRVGGLDRNSFLRRVKGD